jgi:hypothetical protein
MNLQELPFLTNGRSRSISAENPEGKPGAGGTAASRLGRGRKGRPCIELPRGKETVLAQIDGPGIIQHFWVTVTDRTDKGYFVLRDLVLRMSWDGESRPSVEVPLGDFFANGFGARCAVNSLPIVVNPTGGMNCYFPLPFGKGARVTIENQHAADITQFFYQVDYTLVDQLPAAAGTFHAQWRRENLTQAGRDYTILDNVTGKGKYVGTYLAWTSLERFWWGEGEVKFFIDDDQELPTICGTGTEDYFGGAWCFYEDREGQLTETTYSTPFLGYPYFSEQTKVFNSLSGVDMRKLDKVFDLVPKHGLYRWHIADPIQFDSRLRVTIQQIGHDGHGLFERTDDIASVAYWYQAEPHAAFPALPDARARWPR